MSEYNAKNYTEPGGAVTHIGGKLVIEESAEVEGIALNRLMQNQPDSTATSVAALKEDFNALLSKMRLAGYMIQRPGGLSDI